MPGARRASTRLLQCVAGPGDEVILPEPVYATYPAVIAASGRRWSMSRSIPAAAFVPT